MNGTDAGFSVWELLSHADIGVQAIMLILFFASIFSWWLIIEYNSKIKKVEKELERFNFLFVGDKKNKPRSMIEIYKKTKEKELYGIFKVFKSSFKFFNGHSLIAKDDKATGFIEGAYKLDEIIEKESRFLQIYSEQFDIEIDKVEKGLKDKISWLGTISATAPYVGLVGTVYGILIAFWNLGTAQQATIATVAPSIAEALIATGMGLFVAIPALIAYNRLNHRVDNLLDGYENIKKTSEIKIKKLVTDGVDAYGKKK